MKIFKAIIAVILLVAVIFSVNFIVAFKSINYEELPQKEIKLSKVVILPKGTKMKDALSMLDSQTYDFLENAKYIPLDYSDAKKILKSTVGNSVQKSTSIIAKNYLRDDCTKQIRVFFFEDSRYLYTTNIRYDENYDGYFSYALYKIDNSDDYINIQDDAKPSENYYNNLLKLSFSLAIAKMFMHSGTIAAIIVVGLIAAFIIYMTVKIQQRQREQIQ